MMTPYISLLITMSCEESYLIEVALRIDQNRFEDDAYLEEDNKKILRQVLQSEDTYYGPIVRVKQIADIVV